ncbi:glyoxalase Bleomycin resistance, putative [Babesia caballi]|uniref:Glyoxalase Bleomycin resistance, putative n=1 Tax=Babesia caballi TaxID=5871 RepID=A0AAV4M2X5_BABCB|nr:glyoxalase Bleomycin resistance, putative [Babesia caballi]
MDGTAVAWVGVETEAPGPPPREHAYPEFSGSLESDGASSEYSDTGYIEEDVYDSAHSFQEEAEGTTHRTRWASALMSGINPRTRFVNRRFSDLYELPEAHEARRARRFKEGPPSARGDTCSDEAAAEQSEDDCDSSPDSDIHTIRNVLYTINEVVTSLIPRVRFPPQDGEHDADHDAELKASAGYFTRSSSVRSNETIPTTPDSATAPLSGCTAESSEYLAACDDVRTLQRDLDDLLNRNLYDGEECNQLVVYSMLELVALRADYHYRMLQNMERLAQHAWRTCAVPLELVVSLMRVYRSAALEHLEYLRRRIPLKLPHTGVLDFRAWRPASGKAPVDLAHVHAILAQFGYEDIRDQEYLPPDAVRDSTDAQLHQEVEPVQIPPLMFPETATTMTTATDQEAPHTPSQSTEAPFEEEINPVVAVASPTTTITAVSETVAEPEPPKEAAATRRQPTPQKAKSKPRSNSPTPPPRNGKLKNCDSLSAGDPFDDENMMDLFSDYSDAFSRATSQDNLPAPTPIRAEAVKPKSEGGSPAGAHTSVKAADLKPVPRRPAVVRPPRTTETWRNLAASHTFEPVKLDAGGSLKIPKRKRDTSLETPAAAPNAPGGPSEPSPPSRQQSADIPLRNAHAASAHFHASRPQQPLGDGMHALGRRQPRSSEGPPFWPYDAHSNPPVRRYSYDGGEFGALRHSSSIDLYCAARGLYLARQLLRVLQRHVLLDLPRQALHQLLRLPQAQPGQSAHDLDDCDLLGGVEAHQRHRPRALLGCTQLTSEPPVAYLAAAAAMPPAPEPPRRPAPPAPRAPPRAACAHIAPTPCNLRHGAHGHRPRHHPRACERWRPRARSLPEKKVCGCGNGVLPVSPPREGTYAKHEAGRRVEHLGQVPPELRAPQRAVGLAPRQVGRGEHVRQPPERRALGRRQPPPQTKVAQRLHVTFRYHPQHLQPRHHSRQPAHLPEEDVVQFDPLRLVRGEHPLGVGDPGPHVELPPVPPQRRLRVLRPAPPLLHAVPQLRRVAHRRDEGAQQQVLGQAAAVELVQRLARDGALGHAGVVQVAHEAAAPGKRAPARCPVRRLPLRVDEALPERLRRLVRLRDAALDQPRHHGAELGGRLGEQPGAGRRFGERVVQQRHRRVEGGRLRVERGRSRCVRGCAHREARRPCCSLAAARVLVLAQLVLQERRVHRPRRKQRRPLDHARQQLLELARRHRGRRHVDVRLPRDRRRAVERALEALHLLRRGLPAADDVEAERQLHLLLVLALDPEKARVLAAALQLLAQAQGPRAQVHAAAEGLRHHLEGHLVRRRRGLGLRHPRPRAPGPAAAQQRLERAALHGAHGPHPARVARLQEVVQHRRSVAVAVHRYPQVEEERGEGLRALQRQVEAPLLVRPRRPLPPLQLGRPHGLLLARLAESTRLQQSRRLQNTPPRNLVHQLVHSVLEGLRQRREVPHGALQELLRKHRVRLRKPPPARQVPHQGERQVALLQVGQAQALVAHDVPDPQPQQVEHPQHHRQHPRVVVQVRHARRADRVGAARVRYEPQQPAVQQVVGAPHRGPGAVCLVGRVPHGHVVLNHLHAVAPRPVEHVVRELGQHVLRAHVLERLHEVAEERVEIQPLEQLRPGEARHERLARDAAHHHGVEPLEYPKQHRPQPVAVRVGEGRPGRGPAQALGHVDLVALHQRRPGHHVADALPRNARRGRVGQRRQGRGQLQQVQVPLALQEPRVELRRDDRLQRQGGGVGSHHEHVRRLELALAQQAAAGVREALQQPVVLPVQQLDQRRAAPREALGRVLGHALVHVQHGLLGPPRLQLVAALGGEVEQPVEAAEEGAHGEVQPHRDDAHLQSLARSVVADAVRPVQPGRVAEAEQGALRRRRHAAVHAEPAVVTQARLERLHAHLERSSARGRRLEVDVQHRVEALAELRYAPRDLCHQPSEDVHCEEPELLANNRTIARLLSRRPSATGNRVAGDDAVDDAACVVHARRAAALVVLDEAALEARQTHPLLEQEPEELYEQTHVHRVLREAVRPRQHQLQQHGAIEGKHLKRLHFTIKTASGTLVRLDRIAQQPLHPGVQVPAHRAEVSDQVAQLPEQPHLQVVQGVHVGNQLDATADAGHLAREQHVHVLVGRGQQHDPKVVELLHVHEVVVTVLVRGAEGIKGVVGSHNVGRGRLVGTGTGRVEPVGLRWTHQVPEQRRVSVDADVRLPASGPNTAPLPLQPLRYYGPHQPTDVEPLRPAEGAALQQQVVQRHLHVVQVVQAPRQGRQTVVAQPQTQPVVLPHLGLRHVVLHVRVHEPRVVHHNGEERVHEVPVHGEEPQQPQKVVGDGEAARLGEAQLQAASVQHAVQTSHYPQQPQPPLQQRVGHVDVQVPLHTLQPQLPHHRAPRDDALLVEGHIRVDEEVGVEATPEADQHAQRLQHRLPAVVAVRPLRQLHQPRKHQQRVLRQRHVAQVVRPAVQHVVAQHGVHELQHRAHVEPVVAQQHLHPAARAQRTARAGVHEHADQVLVEARLVLAGQRNHVVAAPAVAQLLQQQPVVGRQRERLLLPAAPPGPQRRLLAQQDVERHGVGRRRHGARAVRVRHQRLKHRDPRQADAEHLQLPQREVAHGVLVRHQGVRELHVPPPLLRLRPAPGEEARPQRLGERAEERVAARRQSRHVQVAQQLQARADNAPRLARRADRPLPAEPAVRRTRLVQRGIPPPPTVQLHLQTHPPAEGAPGREEGQTRLREAQRVHHHQRPAPRLLVVVHNVQLVRQRVDHLHDVVGLGQDEKQPVDQLVQPLHPGVLRLRAAAQRGPRVVVVVDAEDAARPPRDRRDEPLHLQPLPRVRELALAEARAHSLERVAQQLAQQLRLEGAIPLLLLVLVRVHVALQRRQVRQPQPVRDVARLHLQRGVRHVQHPVVPPAQHPQLRRALRQQLREEPQGAARDRERADGAFLLLHHAVQQRKYRQAVFVRQEVRGVLQRLQKHPIAAELHLRRVVARRHHVCRGQKAPQRLHHIRQRHAQLRPPQAEQEEQRVVENDARGPEGVLALDLPHVHRRHDVVLDQRRHPRVGPRLARLLHVRLLHPELAPRVGLKPPQPGVNHPQLVPRAVGIKLRRGSQVPHGVHGDFLPRAAGAQHVQAPAHLPAEPIVDQRALLEPQHVQQLDPHVQVARQLKVARVRLVLHRRAHGAHRDGLEGRQQVANYQLHGRAVVVHVHGRVAGRLRAPRQEGREQLKQRVQPEGELRHEVPADSVQKRRLGGVIPPVERHVVALDHPAEGADDGVKARHVLDPERANRLRKRLHHQHPARKGRHPSSGLGGDEHVPRERKPLHALGVTFQIPSGVSHKLLVDVTHDVILGQVVKETGVGKHQQGHCDVEVVVQVSQTSPHGFSRLLQKRIPDTETAGRAKLFVQKEAAQQHSAERLQLQNSLGQVVLPQLGGELPGVGQYGRGVRPKDIGGHGVHVQRQVAQAPQRGSNLVEDGVRHLPDDDGVRHVHRQRPRLGLARGSAPPPLDVDLAVVLAKAVYLQRLEHGGVRHANPLIVVHLRVRARPHHRGHAAAVEGRRSRRHGAQHRFLQLVFRQVESLAEGESVVQPPQPVRHALVGEHPVEHRRRHLLRPQQQAAQKHGAVRTQVALHRQQLRRIRLAALQMPRGPVLARLALLEGHVAGGGAAPQLVPQHLQRPAVPLEHRAGALPPRRTRRETQRRRERPGPAVGQQHCPAAQLPPTLNEAITHTLKLARRPRLSGVLGAAPAPLNSSARDVANPVRDSSSMRPMPRVELQNTRPHVRVTKTKAAAGRRGRRVESTGSVVINRVGFPAAGRRLERAPAARAALLLGRVQAQQLVVPVRQRRLGVVEDGERHDVRGGQLVVEVAGLHREREQPAARPGRPPSTRESDWMKGCLRAGMPLSWSIAVVLRLTLHSWSMKSVTANMEKGTERKNITCVQVVHVVPHHAGQRDFHGPREEDVLRRCHTARAAGRLTAVYWMKNFWLNMPTQFTTQGPAAASSPRRPRLTVVVHVQHASPAGAAVVGAARPNGLAFGAVGEAPAHGVDDDLVICVRMQCAGRENSPRSSGT